MPPIAKVVVEIALDREFDYRVPTELRAAVQLGSRVHVPFGRTTARGYVVGFADHSARPDLKQIAALISPKPLLSETMLKLARWLAECRYCLPDDSQVSWRRMALHGCYKMNSICAYRVCDYEGQNRKTICDCGDATGVFYLWAGRGVWLSHFQPCLSPSHRYMET
ncbi:MAG: hypothetical protein HYV35_08750 [Lentisphaerae bacterium]|nr:hypothetical protein [Lentisphaerota bacterium]